MARTCARWCVAAPTPAASTTSGHPISRRRVRHRHGAGGDGRCRRRVLLRRRYPRLVARPVAAVPHQRGRPAQRSRRRGQRTRPAQVHLHQHLRDGGSSPRPRGDRRRRDRFSRADSLRPIPGSGRKPGDALRRRGRPARRRDVRLDDVWQRRLGRHPARRLHRGRGLRQAAVPDERDPAGSRRRRRCRQGHDPGRRARSHR